MQMLRRPPAVRFRPSPTLIPWLARLVASAAPPRSGPAQAALSEMAASSVALHVRLAEEGLSSTLVKTGAVDVYLRGRGDAPLTGAAARDIEPGLGPTVQGGAHHLDEWVVESRSFVQAMLDDARAHGADVWHGSEVRRIVRDGARVTAVETGRGTITTGHVVLATGLDTATLAAQIGVRLPLRGGRGYVIDVDARGALAMPVRLKEHRVVVTPLPDRVRVCGTIEFGTERRPADLARSDALLGLAVRAVPGLRGRPVLDRWAGDRPCTSDGVPVIGSPAIVPNLSIAAGHGMWGLVLAPVTAQIVADGVVEGQVAEQYAWLGPDRFRPRRGYAAARRDDDAGGRAGVFRRFGVLRRFGAFRRSGMSPAASHQATVGCRA